MANAEMTTKDILQLVYITALIVVAVVALFLLHVLGSLRRRSSRKVVHTIVLGTYTLSYALVSYTLGLMQNSNYYFDEFPVWAVCLLMLLGGTDNLMACKLNDVDDWKNFHVKHLLKGALVVYIVAYYSQHVPEYQKPLWAILSVNVLQSCVRIKSMRMASKSNLLSENVKPIVDHMKSNNEEEPSEEFNLETMKGYNYIVSGERGKKKMDDTKITTVDQIWLCNDGLLSSESKKGMRLKDICLSMALSKMLNRRFAGFKLAEAGLLRTRDFVFKGLLAGDKDNKYERAFRVIEVELGFVYDLYYTRYPFLYHKVRHFALCLPVAMVIFCSWLTYVLFNQHKKEDESHVPLDTTLFLMAVVTFLEAFQLYLHIASDWFKVALIRSYVRRPALRKRFSEMIISLALRLKAHRPWEKKLGQYSLLESYNRTCRKSTCIHYATLFLVDKAKKGRKRGNLVELSAQVKQAVIDSLIRSNGYLTNGTTSLEKHTELSWACKFSTVTETILVWHVATTICKHKFDIGRKTISAVAKDGRKIFCLFSKDGRKTGPLSVPDGSAVDTPDLSVPDSSVVDTASSLSQYCAYLVAFAPDLLPGHSFDSASILDEAIEDTRNFKPLIDDKTMEEKCEKLASTKDTSITNTSIEDSRLIVQGVRLARKLTEIHDKAERWKVLSDFWAEMMLYSYITPCEDTKAQAHLEALARGGEFITHLWALLTHAGVLERDQVFRPMAAV